MKTRLLALAGLLALVTAGVSAAETSANSVSRAWTDKSGRQVQATFGGLDGDLIILQTADGKIHKFPLVNLSKDDQEHARTLKGGGVNVPINLSVSQAAAQIDELVNKMLVKKDVKPNPPSTDEQFLRRAYLDIIGRVPTYDESIGFLIDKSPTKRAKLIDMLLDSPGYGSHLYNYFADMLRVANPDRGGEMSSAQPYIDWLKKSLATNRPYNEIVFDMLSADGKMWTNGATGYLLRDSGMLLDNLANTFSIFLGTDVACAQCHDHPFAEWTQMQFYQLAAFFGATTTRTRGGRKAGEDPAERLKAELTALNPEAAKKVERLVDDIVAANRLEVRDMEQNTLRLPKDYKYKDGVGGEPVEPKFITWGKADRTSEAYKKNKTKQEEKLRRAFAGWLTHPTNPRFGVTIANRLWSRAFGRGVAEPVRNVDDPKASSNPELLVHLGKEMVRLKFNLREFQRILYNTQAWQRASTTEVVPMGADYFFQGPLLRRMSAEQAWDSLVTLVVGDPDRLKNGNTGLVSRVVDIDLEKTTGQVLAQKIEALQQGRAAARAKMTESIASVETNSAQMMMDKKIVSYAGMRLLRASELEQPAPREHFLREFGQSDRQLVDGSSRSGSQPQVLMLMNGPVQQMITNTDSLLIRTMLEEDLPKKQIEALYLCTLSRKPTQAEKTRALEHMKEAGDATGASNLVWALLNSMEFMFVQ